jgi:hypothetical protein
VKWSRFAPIDSRLLLWRGGIIGYVRRVFLAIIAGSEGTMTWRRPRLRGCPGAAGSVGFAMGRKHRVITVDTVPIFGAEAPGMAPVEVDVEGPNTAMPALVVISIATDSGVSIFAS